MLFELLAAGTPRDNPETPAAATNRIAGVCLAKTHVIFAVVAHSRHTVGIRRNVSKLKKQGRSLEETIAARPTGAYDVKWGQFLITPATFTSLVYAGV